MATRKLKFLFWFSALALVLACVPAIGAPVATVDPNQISVFIAQTANAAASQTAAAMPTSTPTDTPTATPDDTNTPSPTYTSTVIFILSTPTSPVIPTFTGVVSSGTSSDNYACQVISVEPANGSVFSGKTGFDAIWRVKNIGKRAWDRNSVDYVYNSGAKMHKYSKYDLSKNLKSGDTISIIVDMETPKDPGSYTTHWVLRNGAKAFCSMSLTINVK